ncbi:archease [Methanobrevibacter sp. OttesenSCG-928-K11]|nr:archease [Methanobrevibacter sp. OttesenSCG-928-K11]MDL2270242.1 archease [Methanobrevibacter sp. OttesenSCG-928-I08]
MKKIKQPFKFFDVTADIGFIAFGNTINESFENAGLAMFNVISDTTNIAKNKEFDFFIESEDEVSLLYDFLEELLFLHEIEFMLFSDFKVKISKNDNNFRLDAKIKGEEINWDIHERGSEIKAITYHLMNVSVNEGFYEVKGIFDL